MFQVSRLISRPLTRALSAKAEGAPQSGFWFGKNHAHFQLYSHIFYANFTILSTGFRFDYVNCRSQ